jgi:hypothetical protein
MSKSPANNAKGLGDAPVPVRHAGAQVEDELIAASVVREDCHRFAVDRAVSRPLGGVLTLMVEDHPHRTLVELLGITGPIAQGSILLTDWSLHQIQHGASSRRT